MRIQKILILCDGSAFYWNVMEMIFLSAFNYLFLSPFISTRINSKLSKDILLWWNWNSKERNSKKFLEYEKKWILVKSISGVCGLNSALWYWESLPCTALLKPSKLERYKKFNLRNWLRGKTCKYVAKFYAFSFDMSYPLQLQKKYILSFYTQIVTLRFWKLQCMSPRIE